MTALAPILDLLQLPSQIDRLNMSWTREADIIVDIKRDDKIHPLISGNKWRKLKYNIVTSMSTNATSIVAFGGAFSNLLVAVATLGSALDIPTVGIVRGYNLDDSNPTIKILRDMGMTLYHVSPREYKLKERSDMVQRILSQYPDHYLIPEGGTNGHAIKGVTEIYDEVADGAYHYIVTPIGTGGTLAGIVRGAGDHIQVIGVSPFKEEISHLAGFDHISPSSTHFKIIPSVLETPFAGYDPQIAVYINAFYDASGILLDPVYTSKSMMTLQHLAAQGYFRVGSRILFIHTGGLQGILGYNYLHGDKMSSPIIIPSELQKLRTYE